MSNQQTDKAVEKLWAVEVNHSPDCDSCQNCRDARAYMIDILETYRKQAVSEFAEKVESVDGYLNDIEWDEAGCCSNHVDTLVELRKRLSDILNLLKQEGE